MKTLHRALIIGLACFYLLLWIGGVGSYVAMGAPPPDAEWTAPVFLLLATAIVLLATPRRELRDVALIAGIGFLSEYLGVATGVVFGEYRYTDALAPRALGVPLVMTCAWTLLVLYVRQIMRSVSLPHLAHAAVAALWMTAIDLVIDPLAAGRLGYWRWAEPGAYFGIPLHNFAGWFAVSLVIFLLLRHPAAPSTAAATVGWSIVLFFTAIALAVGLYIPGAIGLALCAAHPLLIAIRRRTTGARTPAADVVDSEAGVIR